MVMASLWYNKSVYMDCRLTAGFYTTLWWFSDKLWALRLHCSHWFCFCTWWFSGSSMVKLFEKVIPPSRYIESRHLTPQKTNHFTFKAGKFRSFQPSSYSPEIQGFYVVVFMLICCHYVFAVIFMTLLTVPVATLSLNWLLGSYVQYVACTDSSLSLRLYLFIFAQVIRNYITQKWAEHFCGICSPKWQSIGAVEGGGKEDWFDACESPQENQYAHHNPRLT